MQINRLFEIVYVLLDKKIVTAKELSQRFEVSIRTIYRDVETLSSAGVPVYMQKGKGGGISLLPEFVLNKALLSSAEKDEILSALHSVSAAAPSTGSALSKLLTVFGGNNINWLEVDYSDWSDAKRLEFDLLKQAVISRNVITFDYSNTNGENSKRKAEPLTLWFKSRAWYLKAFCLDKQDFRVFRLSRMKNTQITNTNFSPKSMPSADYAGNTIPELTAVTMKIDASMSYRVYDDFDDKDITKNQDGSFTVTFNIPIDNWIYGYILSFGNFAEVIKPKFIRKTIKEMLEKNLEKYI